MEDNGRATNDIVFDEMMQVAVGSVKDGEVGVRWKVVEEIQQCQTRNAYAIFEPIDGLAAVESGLFCNGSDERRHVSVVVPDEKVPHRHNSFVAPRRLTASVIVVRYSLVLQLAEEDRLWRERTISNFPTPSIYSYGKCPFCSSHAYSFRYLASS